MGLDMYFTKETYIWNFPRKGEKKSDREKLRISGLKDYGIKSKRVTGIIEAMGYLRKANAIHGWIVRNVASGVDDCKQVYLDREDIQKLLDIVAEVLDGSKLVSGMVENGYGFDKSGNKVSNMVKGKRIEDPTIAKNLLPVTEGFFFGSYDDETAYDEWYHRDLVETKKILEGMLKEKRGDLYYRASW